VHQVVLERVERRRQAVSAELNAKHRAKFGQFFTPSSAASFLAGLLDLPSSGTFRLLDPGAGVGSLSAAVAARVARERPALSLHITAFELDDQLIPHLTASLEEVSELDASITFEVRNQSFIEYATGYAFETPAGFDACIANPPYKKVNTNAPERVASEAAGLRASNLYTIFTGLSVALLDPAGGQLSTIIPRSWANGPYHESFRRYLLDRLGIDFLHVYESRGQVFADTEVLQENVVLHGVRGEQPDSVVLSTSSGAPDEPRVARTVPTPEVLRPDDPHVFVRIPVDERTTRIAEQIAELPATLVDLGVGVSTGRVVDFRAREFLRRDSEDDTVPLLYPGHMREGSIIWPMPGSRKPNALVGNAETAKLLLPAETYVLVKRFSAKEERRRVVAAVLLPEDLPDDTAAVGIENHINVYHNGGKGLPRLLALGLAAYLNCTLVDDYFRSFSGHTQVNATDLRQMPYPATQDLARLGGMLSARSWPADQLELDALVAECIPAICEPIIDAVTA
jgi:adenine-specific DNA-methyltransferase